MRNTIVVLLLFIVISAKSQEYQILHIKGEIVRVKDGNLLKQGDKVEATEKIKFKTHDAMAAVLSAEKGRYILKATKDNDSQSDLIYVLKATVSPVRGGMSTRAAGINNSMDLKFYFTEAPYVWAGDQIRLDISSYAFPMNDKQFFFIRFGLTDEVVNKRLDFKDEELILDKKTLFTVDDNPINPDEIDNFKLFYYDSTKEESTLITDIEFVLIDTKTLNELYDQFQDSSEDTYYDIADILSDLYGKCDPLQIRFNLMNQ